jgi:hypothetical protein
VLPLERDGSSLQIGAVPAREVPLREGLAR